MQYQNNILKLSPEPCLLDLLDLKQQKQRLSFTAG